VPFDEWKLLECPTPEMEQLYRTVVREVVRHGGRLRPAGRARAEQITRAPVVSCESKRADGQPCKGGPVRGSRQCIAHTQNPAVLECRRAGRRLGAVLCALRSKLASSGLTFAAVSQQVAAARPSLVESSGLACARRALREAKSRGHATRS
jgi:hypothetical protein